MDTDKLLALKIFDGAKDASGIKDYAAAALGFIEGSTAKEQIEQLLAKRLLFGDIFEGKALPASLMEIPPGEEAFKHITDKIDGLDLPKLRLFLWNNYFLHSIAEFFLHVRLQDTKDEEGEPLCDEEMLKASQERVVLFWNAAQKLAK